MKPTIRKTIEATYEINGRSYVITAPHTSHSNLEIVNCGWIEERREGNCWLEFYIELRSGQRHVLARVYSFSKFWIADLDSTTKEVESFGSKEEAVTFVNNELNWRRK